MRIGASPCVCNHMVLGTTVQCLYEHYLISSHIFNNIRSFITYPCINNRLHKVCLNMGCHGLFFSLALTFVQTLPEVQMMSISIFCASSVRWTHKSTLETQGDARIRMEARGFTVSLVPTRLDIPLLTSTHPRHYIDFTLTFSSS